MTCFVLEEVVRFEKLLDWKRLYSMDPIDHKLLRLLTDFLRPQ